MPRKPRLPPEILRIERISDGREFTREDVVDDFSGEVIKAKPDPRPARYVPTPEDHALRAARARAEQHKAVMVLVGWGDKVGVARQQVDVVPTGKMVVGKIKRKDGTELAILKTKPPFRRI